MAPTQSTLLMIVLGASLGALLFAVGLARWVLARSTGTPAIFLHAADAVHGDLGILQPGDPVILISRSGSTAELVRLLPVLRGFKSPLIAIVGNLQSPLATQADVVLDIGARPEADPLGLVLMLGLYMPPQLADWYRQTAKFIG